MTVIGIGTDITEVARIRTMLDKHGDIFLNRVFTQSEQDYCLPRKAADQHLAGRWAAKESILKAIGTGWTKGIGWTEIEIISQPGGKPKVELHGRAAEVCQELGIDEVLISISHVKDTAIAFAIAQGKANCQSDSELSIG